MNRQPADPECMAANSCGCDIFGPKQGMIIFLHTVSNALPF